MREAWSASSAGSSPSAVERPPHPLRLAVEHRRERRLVAGQRGRRGRLEALEQREVARVAEHLDDVTVGRLPLLLERDEKPCCTLAVRLERRDLAAQPIEHDVEIARGPEMPAQPAELLAQRHGPLLLDESSGRAEKRPQATGRDPELVQILRVDAAARARIVREERPVLGARATIARAEPGGVSLSIVGAGAGAGMSSAR